MQTIQSIPIELRIEFQIRRERFQQPFPDLITSYVKQITERLPRARLANSGRLYPLLMFLAQREHQQPIEQERY